MSIQDHKISQDKFLEGFIEKGTVRAGCIKAGIDRSTVFTWNEKDEEFSIRYNQAKEDLNDKIREEIMSRAMEGEERVVTSAGKVVYSRSGEPLTIQEKSDTLLMFQAKARMPEYRNDKQIVVNAVLPKEYINTPEDGIEA